MGGQDKRGRGGERALYTADRGQEWSGVIEGGARSRARVGRGDRRATGDGLRPNDSECGTKVTYKGSARTCCVVSDR